MRAERRKLTLVKQSRREGLMAALGMQSGTLYEKHRRKIEHSSGYMRDGNVSHYVQTKPRRRIRDRKRIGSVFLPSHKDMLRLESCNSQIDDLNGGDGDGG